MNPDLNLVVVPVVDLVPDPENARKHSARNLDAIAGSLRLFGQRRPLVVHGQVVIAGNGTLEAAKSLGWTHVAITRTPADWSVEQARAYALADNRTAELAAWDDRILADQLVELDGVGFELGDLGFAPLKPPDGSEWDSLGDAIKDREPFQQMTFTLSDDQAAVVRDAIQRAKDLGPFVDTGNENGNGNALARIAETFVGMNL